MSKLSIPTASDHNNLPIVRITWVILLAACLAGGGMVACSKGGGHSAIASVEQSDAVISFLEKSLKEFIAEKEANPSDPFYNRFIVRKKGDSILKGVGVDLKTGEMDSDTMVAGFTSAYYRKSGYENAGDMEFQPDWKNEEKVDLIVNLNSKGEEELQKLLRKNKLTVHRETVIRRFCDGRIGAVSTTWRIQINGGDKGVAIAAAIIRAFFNEVTNESDLILGSTGIQL